MISACFFLQEIAELVDHLWEEDYQFPSVCVWPLNIVMKWLQLNEGDQLSATIWVLAIAIATDDWGEKIFKINLAGVDAWW